MLPNYSKLLSLLTLSCPSIILLLFLPLLLPLLLICLIWRKIITYLAKYVQNIEYLVEASDLTFVTDNFNTRPHSNICFVTILNGLPDKDRIISDLERVYNLRNKYGSRIYEKLAFYPIKFCGYWFWKKDEEFNIRNHITILNNQSESQSKSINSEQDLSKFIETIARKSYPVGRGKWEYLIAPVNLYGDANKSVVVFRFSHLVFDGIGFHKFYSKLTNVHTFEEKLQNHPKVKPSFIDRIRSWIKIIIIGPGTLVKEIIDISSDKNLIKKVDFNHLHGELSGDWMCSIAPKIPLVQIKKAKKAFQCTFQDIIFAAISGAIRKFLLKYYEKNSVPEFIHTANPITRPNYPLDYCVNHWNVLLLKVPIKVPEISDRIRMIKEISNSTLTTTMFSTFRNSLQTVAGILPLGNYVDIFTGIGGFTAFVSIIPEFIKGKLHGLETLEVFYWMPSHREHVSAFLFGTLASHGTYRITLTTDKTCIESREMLDHLADLVYKEFIEIFKEAKILVDKKLG